MSFHESVFQRGSVSFGVTLVIPVLLHTEDLLIRLIDSAWRWMTWQLQAKRKVEKKTNLVWPLVADCGIGGKLPECKTWLRQSSMQMSASLPPMYLSVVVLTDDLLKKEIKTVKHFWFVSKSIFIEHKAAVTADSFQIPDSRVNSPVPHCGLNEQNQYGLLSKSRLFTQLTKFIQSLSRQGWAEKSCARFNRWAQKMWFSNLKPEIKGRQTKKKKNPRYSDKYVDAWREIFVIFFSIYFQSLNSGQLKPMWHCSIPHRPWTWTSRTEWNDETLEPASHMFNNQSWMFKLPQQAPLHSLWPQNLTETYGRSSTAKYRLWIGRNPTVNVSISAAGISDAKFQESQKWTFLIVLS